MILRLSSIIIICLSSLIVNAQIAEFGIYQEAGGSLLNRKKDNTLPLAIEYDSKFNEVGFFASDWHIKNQNATGVFMNIRIPQLKVYFGMGLQYKTMDLEFKGFSDFTGTYYDEKYGTYEQYNTQHGGEVTQNEYDQFIDSVHITNQYPFNLLVKRTEFTIAKVNVGYRFNTYKTWRPFIEGSLMYLEANINKIIKVETACPGFENIPDFGYSFSIKGMQLALKSTFGTEWRFLKFYGSIGIPFIKEKLFSEDDQSLPYTRYLQYDLGIALRFSGSIRKKVGWLDNQSYEAATKRSQVFLNDRATSKYEFGIIATAFVNDSPDIQASGFSLLNMDTSIDVLPTYNRYRVRLTYINLSRVEEATGLGAIGVYGSLNILRWLSLKMELQYRPVMIKIGTYSTSMDMVENPFKVDVYVPDKNSYTNSDNENLNLSYHTFPVRLNLVVGRSGTYQLYFGLSNVFYFNKSNFSTENSSNSVEKYEDLYKVLSGKETAENLAGNYLSQSEVEFFTPDRTDMENYFKNPETYFETFERTSFRNKKPGSTAIGSNFGFGYSKRKFTVRIGAASNFIWKGRTFYDGGQTMEVSVTYRLSGR